MKIKTTHIEPLVEDGAGRSKNPTPQASDKLAYTIPETCDATGLGRTRLYEEIKFGRLIARKCGGRTLILRGDLQSWLASLPAIADAK